MRTRPERTLILCEAAVALAAGGVLVAAGILLWPRYSSLPLVVRVLMAAAPLGAAGRLALEAPHLIRGLRAWHVKTTARLLTAATTRRWQDRSTPPATTGNGHDPHI